MTRLTDLSIRKLPHLDKQKIYFDTSLPGFGVRVSKRHKTFVVLYGTPRKYKTLGRYMPVVPIVGQHEFVVEEYFGMKVARLVSPPQD